MSDSTPELELYNLQGCPYCAKVRRALDDLDLAYETHDVPGSRSKREAVHAASGQRGVPVLVDRTNRIEGMPESDDIVAYLYEEYGDGESPPPSGIVGRVLSALF
jgi:glutaredoxin